MYYAYCHHPKAQHCQSIAQLKQSNNKMYCPAAVEQ